MAGLKQYISNKIIHPLLSFLKQGISSEKLSLTLALGVSFGIMPFLGINSIILTGLALMFHLNIAAIQLVNYAVYLLQIVFFVPFLKLGQFIFLSSETTLNFDGIFDQITLHFWESIAEIWHIVFSGLLIWVLISIPLSFIIYYSSKPFFYKQEQKLKLSHKAISSSALLRLKN
ncbi:MAG: hypothetical protein DRI95_04610 [Bacteroidetes bacterium]|nr:MAG: hypothetical protein DRI95_04610 [Bacteroidota bacterium]